MTWLDWSIVLILNVSVIGFGFYLGRGTKSSSEWFLGGRSLPWWAVGMSMFATNMDSADLVGVTGQTFNEGVHLVSVYALGSTLGGVMAAFVIVPAIYKLGFYTNAEYLEARFGTTVRVLSAFIQLQYRSIMLGMMIWSMYLLLTRLVALPPVVAWTIIVGAVLFSGGYTSLGGLRSVVWTDAMQGLVMIVGAAVILFAVWNQVGGWQGVERSLAEAGDVNGVPLSDFTHIGRYRGAAGDISPWVVMLGWMIIGCGYWTVNHTQTMRLMGVRTLWDMKMAAVFGVAVSLPVAVASAFLGVFGRALPEFRNLEDADTLYPLLANAYLGPGLKGLVVAGVIAAVISTFDSMGSALSAIFTRDFYARMIVRDGDDGHYVKVTRVATIGVLCLGFLYLPFILLQENMLRLLTTLIPVFVTPLMTVYIVGILTPAHRKSGVIGLLAGSAYGLLSLADRSIEQMQVLPDWLANRWWAYPTSIVITGAAMGLATAIFGVDTEGRVDEFSEVGWLERSRGKLPPIRLSPFPDGVPWYARPELWATALAIFCGWLQFRVFW